MIITQISVEDLMSGLSGVSIGSNSISSESNGDVSFGNLILAQESGLEGTTESTTKIDLTALEGIKSTEISDQIKNALASGGKIKLEINNPKTILTSLVKLTSQIESDSSPLDTVEGILKIKLDNLLKSLKVNEIVVDDEEVTEVLDDFVASLATLFDNTIKVAQEKEIPNLDQLTATIEEIFSDLKGQIVKITGSNSKEIHIDLAKIKLSIPDEYLKEIIPPGTEVNAPVVLVNNSPDKNIVIIAKDNEISIKITDKSGKVSGNEGEIKLTVPEIMPDQKTPDAEILTTKSEVEPAKGAPETAIKITTPEAGTTEAGPAEAVKEGMPEEVKVNTADQPKQSVNEVPKTEVKAEKPSIVLTEKPVVAEKISPEATIEPEKQVVQATPTVEKVKLEETQNGSKPEIKQPEISGTITQEIKTDLEDNTVTLVDSKGEAEQEVKNVSPAARIKEVLSPVIDKVLSHLNLKKVASKEAEVVLKVIPPQNQNTEVVKTGNNLLEKIDLLQKIAPENLEKIEVKVSPDRQEINTLKTNLFKALNSIKNVLNQELNQGAVSKVDVQKIENAVETRLNSILDIVKSVEKENQVEIIVPKIAKTLADVPLEKPVKTTEVVTDKPAISKPEVKTDIKPEIIPEKQTERDTTEQQRKPVLPEFDKQARTLKGNKHINLQSEGTQKLHHVLRRSLEANEQVLNNRLRNPEPETRKNSIDTGSFDLSSKNIFNLLLSKNNDPALAGLKFNNAPVFANNTSSLSAAASFRTSESVVNQVIDKIRGSFNKNEINVELNPRNLGKVNVNVVLQKGVLVANIVADTMKAVDSLKMGVDSLRQTLVENGFNVDRIVVSAADNSSNTHNNTHNENQNGQQNKDGNSNSSNNQQDKQSYKDAMEFAQNKQSQGNRHSRGLQQEQNNTDNNNTNTQNVQSNTTSTVATEENYIDTQRGRVNYRV